MACNNTEVAKQAPVASAQPAVTAQQVTQPANPPPQATPAKQAEPIQMQSAPINKAPPKPPTNDTAGEPSPFGSWDKVLTHLSTKHELAYASLRNTKAYLDDKNGRVLISGGELFLEFMRKDKQANSIVREAIAAVCGYNYAIGPYAEASDNAETADATLKHLESLGVPIQYE